MTRATRSTITLAIVVLVVVIVATLAAVRLPAGAQTPPPQSRDQSVDYWQPLWMQRELWGPGQMPPGMRARLLRHFTYMQYGVQKQYEGAKSTVGNSKGAIEAGGKLYAEKCATCHGKGGMGDGDPPRSLLPSPALLAFMIQRPVSVDEYLLWSIAEGGAQFQTEMPAFKDTLTQADIWMIIAYMRAGFPGDTGNPPKK
jgi:mono/diheme cytochrome c family protein